MRQRPYSFLLMAVVTVALALLSACGAATQQTNTAPPVAPDENDQTSRRDAAQIAETLPADFPVTVYQGDGLEEGEQVMLSELVAQGKPVVVNFWAGLCPPCRLEMPDLQAASQTYEDRILLIGLDVGPFTALGTHEDGRRLLRDLEITYPAGTTPEPDVLRDYEIRGMPSTYFILPDGQLHLAWTGILTEERLSELVDEMLAESAQS